MRYNTELQDKSRMEVLASDRYPNHSKCSKDCSELMRKSTSCRCPCRNLLCILELWFSVVLSDFRHINKMPKPGSIYSVVINLSYSRIMCLGLDSRVHFMYVQNQFKKGTDIS